MKNTLNTTLLAVILMLCHSVKTNAQTVLPASDVQLLMEPTQQITITPTIADTLLDPMTLLGNTPMNITVEIILQDSLNTNKIHVKVGRTNGGNDIINQTFDYDALPPPGTTYYREQNTLMLGIGNHHNIHPIYAEVTIEDHNGETSAATTFSY